MIMVNNQTPNQMQPTEANKEALGKLIDDIMDEFTEDLQKIVD